VSGGFSSWRQIRRFRLSVPCRYKCGRNVSQIQICISSGLTIQVLNGIRFDRELMRERGKAIGREFRGKGVNVALGPMMYALFRLLYFTINQLHRNIGRVAEGGRNWEGLYGRFQLAHRN
jgi:hypothetical protein